MKVPVYDKEGKEAGTLDLPESQFMVPFKHDLVHQAKVTYLANARQVSAHAKGRGEVSGGGKKPWRQKGTGRARHGSVRSPIWVGGGVAHGPQKERNYAKRLNKKMRRTALLSVLSEKLRANLLFIVEQMDATQPKTKALQQFLNQFPVDAHNTLLVLAEPQKVLLAASRNLSYVRVAQAQNLNILDLLWAKFVIMPKESVEIIQKTFAK